MPKTKFDSIWYERIDLNKTGESRCSGTFEWAKDKLTKFYVQRSLEEQIPVFSKTLSGFFDLSNKQEIIEYFTSKRCSALVRYENEYSEVTEDQIWLGEDDLVALTLSSENYVSIEYQTHDHEALHAAQEFLKNKLTKRTKNNLGKAHVLSTSYDGLQTRELGVVGVKFHLNNYTAAIHEGLNEIVEDLKSPLPNGKLTILEGPPGTGKTFLVRSLISEISNAFFVIVPPSMVGKLGDPSIIPVLLRLKSKDDDLSDEELMEKAHEAVDSNPIVIIVEDADDCLVKREAGDMASISTVLNLTSGILGDLLDVRIIATTNRKKTELDDALVRENRLSYHLEVGPLEFNEAEVVYQRLLNNPEARLPNDFGDADNDNKVLLTSVYREAKNKGYRARTEASKPRTNVQDKKKNKIGF